MGTAAVMGRVDGRWPKCTAVSILMRESLKLHGLGRIHFFSESEQVECGVGADILIHTSKYIKHRFKNYPSFNWNNQRRL